MWAMKSITIRLRLTEEEKAAWARAADKDGRDLSNWLRWVANRAAGMIDGPARGGAA